MKKNKIITVASVIALSNVQVNYIEDDEDFSLDSGVISFGFFKHAYADSTQTSTEVVDETQTQTQTQTQVDDDPSDPVDDDPSDPVDDDPSDPVDDGSSAPSYSTHCPYGKIEGVLVEGNNGFYKQFGYPQRLIGNLSEAGNKVTFNTALNAQIIGMPLQFKYGSEVDCNEANFMHPVLSVSTEDGPSESVEIAYDHTINSSHSISGSRYNLAPGMTHHHTVKSTCSTSNLIVGISDLSRDVIFKSNNGFIIPDQDAYTSKGAVVEIVRSNGEDGWDIYLKNLASEIIEYYQVHFSLSCS